MILNASPRRKGNIAQMVSEMTDEAKAQGAEVEVINVQKLNVKPCMACMQCRSKGRCDALTQTSPRPLSPLWQSPVITLAVGCQPFGRVTTTVSQYRQSRLCG